LASLRNSDLDTTLVLRWHPHLQQNRFVPQYSGGEVVKRFSLERGAQQKVLLTSE
jgi:hypothetical protein